MNYAKRHLTTGGISYTDQGCGRAVVLLHGVGLCADVWLPQQRALASTSRVISVDLPGHGGSAELPGESSATLEDYARILEVSLAEVTSGPVVLVGHSLGALLAIRLANSARLNVSGVVLISCIYDRSQQARDAVQQRARELHTAVGQDLTQSTLARWFGAQPRDSLRADALSCRRWLNDAQRRGYPLAYRVFAAQRGPSVHHLQELQIPALFVTGGLDINSTPAMSQALASLAPYGQAHIVEGGAHMIGMTHAPEVNSVLSEFSVRC